MKETYLNVCLGYYMADYFDKNLQFIDNGY